MGVTAVDAAFNWGYRVREDQKSKTKANKFQVLVEKVDEPTISNLEFDLKPSSLLMVIG